MNLEGLGAESLAPELREIALPELQPYRHENFASQVEYLEGIEGLSESRWAELTPAERLETLKDLESRLAEMQGRDPRQVIGRDYPSSWFSTSKTWGHYSETNPGELNINNELLRRPELRLKAFDTLVHEGRHAFQHDAIRGLVQYNPEVVTYWRANWDHYLSGKRFGLEIYQSQPIEIDARSYAAKIVGEIKSRDGSASLAMKESSYGNSAFDLAIARQFSFLVDEISRTKLPDR